MLVHGVVIALVPWLLDSSELIYGRRSRPLPGQDRRGEPRRPMPARRPGRSTPESRAAAAAEAIAAANAEVRGAEAASRPAESLESAERTSLERVPASTRKH
jgi:hypothetical protein